MSFVRINGVLLHYRLLGPEGAPAIAFINSLGTDTRIWDDVVDALRGRFRLLVYDKRGHGLSDTPAGEYTLAHHVDDLAGVLDHLAIAAATLCGVSIGGLIAQAFALAHPHRVERLVLCDTAARFGDAATWAGRMDDVRRNGMSAVIGGVMDRWFGPAIRAARPDDVAGWHNLVLRTPAAGYAATCATLRDADLTPDLARIAVPTLVVGGTEDRSTPVEQVRAFAAAIPGASFAAIADAGHIPSIDQPAALARLIASFVEEAGRA